MRLFAYNKPKGEEAVEAVYKNPETGDEVKVYPASKMAPDDQGLVIYTDDASQVEAVKAIADEAEMECHVDADKHLNVPIIHQIRTGIDGVSPACRVSWTEANAVVINLKPCRRKELDAIFANFDCKVELVKRYRVANLKIKKTPLGEFEEYSEDEVKAFLG